MENIISIIMLVIGFLLRVSLLVWGIISKAPFVIIVSAVLLVESAIATASAIITEKIEKS